MTQLSFATLDHRNKKKQTKRERFLGEMNAASPSTKNTDGKRDPEMSQSKKGNQ